MNETTVFVPESVSSLRPLCDAGVLGAADVHLAAWIARAMGAAHPHVVFAVAMTSWAARHGHSCVDLDLLPSVVERELRSRSGDGQRVDVPALSWPAVDEVIATLSGAPVVRVVDAFDADPPLDDLPLVLFGRRVYLQRHWVDECGIAASLRSRVGSAVGGLGADATALLDALLPATLGGRPNLQRAAADMVLANRLAVVVGGPGTGKTYSVARLLAVLLAQAHSDGTHLSIGVAAPTGKAAQRLRESILGALQHDPSDGPDPIPAHVRDALSGLVPRTIHRLLGSKRGVRQRFAHDATTPMRYDIVVIDETSMVSAPLLARLLEAVHPSARVVMLGDPDQLESVDRGAVLADIVAAGEGAHATGPLVGHVARLLRGHRFEADSPIAVFADAVRVGAPDDAVQALRALSLAAQPSAGVHFVETDQPLHPAPTATVEAVVRPRLAAARTAAEAGDAPAALEAMASVRVLCAHREGPCGVAEWNRLGERWMCGPHGAPGLWYPGRPLLVTSNDPRLGLSNGDAGVVVRSGDRMMVAFPGHDMLFEPAQLDHVETAFAMTVHKSQGSEYPTVVMVLPPLSSPLVGRELVYTGVTRAKTALYLIGSAAALAACVATPAVRMTGLDDALRA